MRERKTGRHFCPHARWRQRMGEEKLKALLQESLNVAVKTEAPLWWTRPFSLKTSCSQQMRSF
jgi:hypothetical protein